LFLILAFTTSAAPSQHLASFESLSKYSETIMPFPNDQIRPAAQHGPNNFEMAPQERLPEQNPAQPPGPSRYERFIRSFDEHEPGPEYPDGQLAWALDQSLKGYHSQLIALGSAIGTGLFIASGEGLAIAGPIPLLGAFCFVGFTLCPTVFALGEMATLFPLPGGFFEHCRMYTDEAWGGAMGWKYVLTQRTLFNR
jgi:amino acid permease